MVAGIGAYGCGSTLHALVHGCVEEQRYPALHWRSLLPSPTAQPCFMGCPSHPSPACRAGPEHGVLILHGGRSESGRCVNDTWLFDIARCARRPWGSPMPWHAFRGRVCLGSAVMFPLGRAPWLHHDVHMCARGHASCSSGLAELLHQRPSSTLQRMPPLAQSQQAPHDHTPCDNSNTPRGASYDSSTPRGTSYDSNTPRGASYDSSTPRGTSYDSNTPRGTIYDSNTPRGTSYDPNTPRGTIYDSNTPRGTSTQGYNSSTPNVYGYL